MWISTPADTQKRSARKINWTNEQQQWKDRDDLMCESKKQDKNNNKWLRVRCAYCHCHNERIIQWRQMDYRIGLTPTRVFSKRPRHARLVHPLNTINSRRLMFRAISKVRKKKIVNSRMTYSRDARHIWVSMTPTGCDTTTYGRASVRVDIKC